MQFYLKKTNFGRYPPDLINSDIGLILVLGTYLNTFFAHNKDCGKNQFMTNMKRRN